MDLDALWRSSLRSYFSGPFYQSTESGGGGGAGGGATGSGNQGAGEAGAEGGEGGAGAGEAGNEGGAGKLPKTQEEFDAVITDRLARATAKVAADTRAAVLQENKDAETRRIATEKGELEPLLKLEKERADRLEAELKESNLANLRTKVATTYKLSPELAKYLVGDDEPALVTSAKELAKHLKGVKEGTTTESGTDGGGTNAGNGNPNGAQGGKQAGKEAAPALTPDGRPKVAWPNKR